MMGALHWDQEDDAHLYNERPSKVQRPSRVNERNDNTMKQGNKGDAMASLLNWVDDSQQ